MDDICIMALDLIDKSELIYVNIMVNLASLIVGNYTSFCK